MEILRSTTDLAKLEGPLFLAIGAFDGVHLGHQAVISTSARHAHSEDGTPVVVTFDPHPAKVLRPENPPHLITSTPHKIALIRTLGVGHLLIIPFDKNFAQTEAEDFVAQLTESAKPLCEIWADRGCLWHNHCESFSLATLERTSSQFEQRRFDRHAGNGRGGAQRRALSSSMRCRA